ncbi:hypothetical protein [Neobacillus niacini]|uniref:hypothetical protein n=1 Tax=Neobacillus niacini TaxID=86668 RepID=UPI00286B9597|nr:hypothetical protein [Neobacillus niacini]
MIILLLLLFVIFLFTRKDKDQVIESFSLGDFLHQSYLEHKDTTIITKINNFFDSDIDDGNGEGIDDGDGGE